MTEYLIMKSNKNKRKRVRTFFAILIFAKAILFLSPVCIYSIDLNTPQETFSFPRINKCLTPYWICPTVYLSQIWGDRKNVNLKFYFQCSYTASIFVSNIYVDNFNLVDVYGLPEFGKNFKIGNKNPEFIVVVPRNAKKLFILNIGSPTRNIELALREWVPPLPTKSILTEQILHKRPVEKKLPTLEIYTPLLNNNIARTEEPILTISGKTTDESGIFMVLINDQHASLLKDGTFQKRIRLSIGKNPVRIEVSDINENKKILNFNIIRQEFIRDEEFTDVDFPPRINKKKTNAIGVVIGIEEYSYAPKAEFAYNDAETFRQYLIHTFGISPENIYFRTNERATKGEFEKVFSSNGWLKRIVKEGISDIFIYFAGHGAPDLQNKGAFLIPHDIDPAFASTGYSLGRLYDDLRLLKAKSVIIILDTCFSGVGRGNVLLLKGSRPVSIEPVLLNVPDEFAIFTSTSGSEYSSSLDRAKHGLFTYYFLKGLSGDADKDKDNRIFLYEMEKYLSHNVKNEATKLGRSQTPQLLAKDKNRILIEY